MQIEAAWKGANFSRSAGHRPGAFTFCCNWLNVHVSEFSTKQIAMCAGAFKPDVRGFFGKRINQQPVRFNVAVATAGKVSAQRVIFVLCRQFITCNQQVKDGLELFQIFAALAGQFDIFLELRCAADGPHKPKSA